MFNRLQNSFEREVQFNSDVSHELRTPISVIMAQSEYGKDNVSTLSESKDIFNVILKEAQKMSHLVSQLLTLARMDKGHHKLNLNNVNISELSEIIIDSQKGNAETKNITIFSEITPDIYANIDESMMMRVFINLLSNAVTYGKIDGNIHFKLYSQEKILIIEISDDGIGISSEHIDKIWTRFYQVDPSRNSNGAGLGLSMVKWIVEAHNGNISVTSEVGKGTVFTIQIPL